MATSKPATTINIVVTPRSILSGGVVTLTATLANPPKDWQTNGYKIVWYANYIPLSDPGLKTDPDNPLVATWDTTGLPDTRTPRPPTNATSIPITAWFVDTDGNIKAESPIIDLTVSAAPRVTLDKPVPSPVEEGKTVDLSAQLYANKVDALNQSNITVVWEAGKGHIEDHQADPPKATWNTTGLFVGSYAIAVNLVNSRGRIIASDEATVAIKQRPLSERSILPVALQRTAAQPTRDQALWVAIRNRTKAIAFSGSGYKSFIDAVLCDGAPPRSAILARQRSEYGRIALDPARPTEYNATIVAGVGAYELLKTATEVFLLLNCGVAITERDPSSNDLLYEANDEATRLGAVIPIGEITGKLNDYLGAANQLPYLRRVVDAAFPGLSPDDTVHCPDILIRSRVDAPCLLELIWSYWHEEGMLVQTINAVSQRFQNLRNGSGHDPLAHLEIDPIRPLNNVLWGYIQDEQHRLTVQRRAYEYDHHYGITLYGKAVPSLKSVDSRSKFIEAFHNLLHLTSIFYQEDDDTTRLADAFPVLNALKETHLLLAQGAHNQFGDLPWTARVEMLMQQWMLARPEMRDFLQSRPMVPYQEGWMGQVDTMKKLQGWSDVTVTHFHDLGVYGEQLLLSARYGDWIGVNDPAQAANWARYWRPEVQSYSHAYRAATGVDLTAETVDSTMPSALLRNRLAAQTRTR